MFGKSNKNFQNEKTPFYPRSPYAVSKMFSHWITINYRESFNLFACNGILFNHESPYRGETFVTLKIVRALCRIKHNKQKKLYLGNIYSRRDWGHAEYYVQAMWKILNHRRPDDFVISTGKQYSVKQFVDLVAKKLKIKITWKGKGIKEKAYLDKNTCIIECKKEYFRLAEVDNLRGNYSKAKKLLNWKPERDINYLINDMIASELKKINKY